MPVYLKHLTVTVHADDWDLSDDQIEEWREVMAGALPEGSFFDEDEYHEIEDERVVTFCVPVDAEDQRWKGLDWCLRKIGRHIDDAVAEWLGSLEEEA